MNNSTTHYHFETLSDKSVAELNAIEQQAHSHPMSEKTIASCFGALYHNIGLYKDNQLLGFAIVHQVIDEATLMDICIAPDAQGLGLGRALIDEIINSLKARDAVLLQLEVRASNRNAIELYKKTGFIEVGRRTDYYPTDSGREDAILMELKLLFS